jgi:hypothetical protein
MGHCLEFRVFRPHKVPDYEHRLRGRACQGSLAVARFEIEASYRHRPDCLEITPWIVYSPRYCRGFTTDAELIVATDRRIGTPGAALPTKGNRLLGPEPTGRANPTNLAKYQRLQALTQRAVYRPDASGVDDSSRLAQWRLASPEPRGDVRDAVPLIQGCRKRGDSRMAAR